MCVKIPPAAPLCQATVGGETLHLESARPFSKRPSGAKGFLSFLNVVILPEQVVNGIGKD